MKKDYRNEFNKIKYLMNYNILKEYSADQRLPFDDNKFRNKNYFEQYLDWLEDFGKYGTLPKSKLDFWDEVKKAIKHIIDNNLKNHAGLGLSDSFKENFNKLKNIIDDKVVFDDSNNIYVEREIVINYSIEQFDDYTINGKDPMELYNKLIDYYNNNVGGCWSYRKDNAESYCTRADGDSIVLKGYIRTDDIDFVKTVLLNFHYPNEHEIRVKPNAKVELTEVICNCKYKLPLKGSLIVSATYFGNNGKYNGDYAPVDDGFGNNSYMDRKGNIKTIGDMVKERISNGEPLNRIFTHVFTLDDGFKYVQLDNKKSFLDKNNNLIYNGKLWFDSVEDFNENLIEVKIGDKKSFLKKNYTLTANGKIWFDEIKKYFNGLIKVNVNDKFSLLTNEGDLISNGKLWFTDIGYFHQGFVKVELNNKYSFVSEKGSLIGNGNLWFDGASDFNDGLAWVVLKKKSKLEYSFINTKGNLIGNGKLWFDSVSPFSNGFAIVEKNNKSSFINIKGNYIGNGNLWFDYVKPFEGGIAPVMLNGKFFCIDENGEKVNEPFKHVNVNLLFEHVKPYNDNLTIVVFNEKYSFINSNNELIYNGGLWFDSVEKFQESALVSLDKKYTVILPNGELLDNGNTWFDNAYFLNNHHYELIVQKNGKYNLLSSDGKYAISNDLWFDNITPDEDFQMIPIAKLKDNYYRIKNGKLLPYNLYNENVKSFLKIIIKEAVNNALNKHY